MALGSLYMNIEGMCYEGIFIFKKQENKKNYEILGGEELSLYDIKDLAGDIFKNTMGSRDGKSNPGYKDGQFFFYN